MKSIVVAEVRLAEDEAILLVQLLVDALKQRPKSTTIALTHSVMGALRERVQKARGAGNVVAIDSSLTSVFLNSVLVPLRLEKRQEIVRTFLRVAREAGLVEYGNLSWSLAEGKCAKGGEHGEKG